MDRITFDGNFCDISMCRENPCPYNGMCSQRETWERLKKYEDAGLEPDQVMELKSFTQGGIHKVDDGWKHVQDLFQAEKEGRLVVLPCKVGSTVYGHSKDEVFAYKVAVISLATYNWYLRCQNNNSDFWVTDADIGKTVFLTRDDAEAALKGGEG